MAGRPKGSKTRYSTTLQRQMLHSDNPTPLEYLVSVYTDESNSLRDRLDAAKAAAPYVHPRLSTVEVSNQPLDGDAKSISNEQLIAIISGGAEKLNWGFLRTGQAVSGFINPNGCFTSSTGRSPFAVAYSS